MLQGSVLNIFVQINASSVQDSPTFSTNTNNTITDLYALRTDQMVITSSSGSTSICTRFSIAISVPVSEEGQVPQAP